MLVLSTLFGSTTRALPSTTSTTYIEYWMIFSISITFAELMVQTIIVHYKSRESRQEQKQKLKVDKMEDPGGIIVAWKSEVSLVLQNNKNRIKLNLSTGYPTRKEWCH